jgi:hypothetical protein
MAELSEGRTVTANVALLESNARVAAQVATALAEYTKEEQVETMGYDESSAASGTDGLDEPPSAREHGGQAG